MTTSSPLPCWPKPYFHWLIVEGNKKEERLWWWEGKIWASCRRDDGQVLSPAPPGPPLSSFFTGLAGEQGSVSAAKDTGVSAMRLGNIVHQAASVMGSSLWQWSSGHKSKRAHKHHMTDGWEDSFGQGGRDGEREIKWDREREAEGQGWKRDLTLDCYEKSQTLVYGCTCSMSTVKRETGNHKENTLQPMSSNKAWTVTSNENSRLLLEETDRWKVKFGGIWCTPESRV